MAQLPCIAVVGIDFGTTFSGITFSIKGDDNILEVWEYPAKERHPQYPKTPTSLYYDNNTPPRPIAFGWEADELNTNKKLPGFYTKLFKLSIAPDKMKSKIEQYPTPPGIKPEQCIADYLRFFKELALNKLEEQKASGKIPKTMARNVILQQIQWSLTVPAIWEEKGKQAMRLAAQQAGLVTSALSREGSVFPLLICLEPEAASMYSAREPTFFQSLFGSRNQVITFRFKLDRKPGDPYMILDIGGGTTDIAVHAFGDNGGHGQGKFLREVIVGSGALVGGSFIDQYFIELAEEKIPCLADFAEANPGEYQRFLKNWDKAKRVFELRMKKSPRSNQTRIVEDTVIELPTTLQKFWYDRYQADFEGRGLDEDGANLTLTVTEMRSLFDPAIDSIVELTVKQASKVRGAKAVVLVGGLSESPYISSELYTKLKSHFDNVYTPPNAGRAVAKGATVFGMGLLPPVPGEPLKMKGRVSMSHRISRLTYAVDTVNGLHTWVKAGEAVPADKCIPQTLVPADELQSDLVYEVYSSGEAVITKENSERALRVVFDLPVTLGIPRSYNSRVYFGDTTIRVEAINSTTGKEEKCELDFEKK